MPPVAPVDALTGLSASRLGVYVHFPYCLAKCPYCDFASIAAKLVPEERYEQAVLTELQARVSQVPTGPAQSVYFGGGTPSLWACERVERVLERIRERLGLAAGAEVTLEANPGAADEARFEGYRAAGVNRLSIGVQSFQPSTLHFLGRAHSGDDAVRAFEAARAAGFDNVSLDFIYGVPGQTLGEAVEDAQRAAALAPEHLSAYALTLDKASLAEEVPLAKQLARGEVSLPPDEVVVAMQRGVSGAYASAGLKRYEVSNYAKPGFHSRHNALYWTGGEYLALGAGATGYFRAGEGGMRYANHRAAERYFAAVEAGGRPEASTEALSRRELFEERLAMGLRLSTGVDLTGVCAAFGEDFVAREAEADRLVAGGFALRDGARLKLTERGADLHSAISARLM